MNSNLKYGIQFFLFVAIGIFCIGCGIHETHSSISITQKSPDIRIESKSALAPVYAPLAEWLVERFQLAEKSGIGIDLGSGSGDLIVELAQRTPQFHWINADINPKNFARFFEKTQAVGVSDRVSAQLADAQRMPYRDNYADIVVSRGSFPFWGDIQSGLGEVQRILKPGGIAYIGRGFSENLPVDIARSIRDRQEKNQRFPRYDVDETEQELRRMMKELGIKSYQIHRPHPVGSEGVNYGIWLEWKKTID